MFRYKVLRVTPKSGEHVDILRKLRNNTELDFWAFSPLVGSASTFSVGPDELPHVLDAFKDAHIPSEIIIENLQE